MLPRTSPSGFVIVRRWRKPDPRWGRSLARASARLFL